MLEKVLEAIEWTILEFKSGSTKSMELELIDMYRMTFDMNHFGLLSKEDTDQTVLKLNGIVTEFNLNREEIIRGLIAM